MTSTNFINGVTNAVDTTTLGNFVAPDPTLVHTFWDDFDRFNFVTAATTVDPTGVADWSVALTFSAGTPTSNIIQADGGILQLVNGTSDDANSFVRWKGQNATTVIAETFRWASTKQMWYKARFQVSDATQSDLIMGLAISDQSPLDASDGIFFTKSDGSTSLSLKLVKNSTATTISIGTMADATYVTVGWYWDPAAGRLTAYLNDVAVGSTTTTTNMPDDEDLTVTFGIQNGEAASKTMSIDYILVSKERG